MKLGEVLDSRSRCSDFSSLTDPFRYITIGSLQGGIPGPGPGSLLPPVSVRGGGLLLGYRMSETIS